MADLTEQQRQAQLRLRARALLDFTALWSIWQADDPATFGTFVTATLVLVRAYYRLSASLAAGYYQSFRTAEGVAGAATPRLADALPEAKMLASLYATGQATYQRALRAGRSSDQARESALARMAGAVTRLILEGGRTTLLQSVAADPEAIGWARVTDGNPCYFCLTLAARGAVYKSEQSASFQAHDHCGCSAMPVFKGTTLPAATQRFQELYDRAQREGIDSGLLQPGENSSAARLNAVRALLVAEQGDSSGT